MWGPPEEFRQEALPDGPKILCLDIETMAAKAYVWGPLYDTNVGLNQIIEYDRVICFAAKWVGQKRTMFFSEYDDGGPVGLAQKAHDLLDQADYLVTYNGASFDVKHLHRLMLTNGVAAPNPHKDVDLMRVVKAKFRMLSNKLQSVVTEMEIGSKLQHSGFDLWRGWDNQDAASLRTMKRYCMHDVVVTEQVFMELREGGWLDGKIPPPGRIAGWSAETCEHCGHDEFIKNGRIYLPSYTYQRYQCKGCRRNRKGERIK